jgi:hypothetical protein
VCSPVSETVATTLDQATKFLHEGPDPLQVDLDASALDPRRVAGLRGKITHPWRAMAGSRSGRIRFPDLEMRGPSGQHIVIQVGRRTLGGSPVAREVRALEALRGTGDFDHVFFIGY